MAASEKGKKGFDAWWHTRSALIKALLVIGIIVFSAAAVFCIFKFAPLNLPWKAVTTAAYFALLNFAVYILIHWNKRVFQTVLMIYFTLVLGLVMVFFSVMWQPILKSMYNYDDTFPTDSEQLAAVPVIEKKITNIALFGVDTRSKTSFKGNADSIMILSLNSESHTVKIISVLRDSLVPIERNGNTTYKKINSAYSSGGPELAVRTLNQIFGLDITEYATVNFYGMAQMIDAVGGIDAELTDAETGDNINHLIREIANELGVSAKEHYIYKGGKMHLNGIQAVAYSRIRYVKNIWGTTDDYGRTDRQRYVMEQLFNKAITLSASEYPNMIKTMIPFMVTSLDPNEILNLATSVLLESPKFYQTRIPDREYLMSAPSGLGSIVYYDLEFAADLIHAFIYDGMTFDAYIGQNGIRQNDWYNNGFLKTPN